MTRRNNSFLKRQKEQKRIERANQKRAERMARRKSRAERADTDLPDAENETSLDAEHSDSPESEAATED